MSDVSNWIVPFGMHIEDASQNPEHGTFRINKGTIMFYDCASDQFVPTAVQYDGAPDSWGSTKNYEDLEQPSGSEWIGAVTIDKQGDTRKEFYEAAWQVGDGFTEAHSLGLPGLYSLDKNWVTAKFNRVCNSCFIYTPKSNVECEHCGVKEMVAA